MYIHRYRYIYDICVCMCIYIYGTTQNLSFMIDYSRLRYCKYLKERVFNLYQGKGPPKCPCRTLIFSIPPEYSRRMPNILYSAGSKIQDSSGTPWKNLGSRSRVRFYWILVLRFLLGFGWFGIFEFFVKGSFNRSIF